MIADPFSRMVIIPTGMEAMSNREIVTGEMKKQKEVDVHYCGFRTKKTEETGKDSILELEINNMEEAIIHNQEEKDDKRNGIPS